MESARETAFDWFMKLEADPDNAALKREFECWRKQSDENHRAYSSVLRMLCVAKELPPNYAAANRSVRTKNGRRFFAPANFSHPAHLLGGSAAAVAVLCLALVAVLAYAIGSGETL